MSEKKQTHTTSALRYRIALPALLTIVLFVGAMLFVLFPTLEESFLARKQEMTRRLVESAFTLVGAYEQREISGELSRAEAQFQASEALRAMRYGDDGLDYFWINDLTPVMIMHPYRPDLEGRDISTFSDPTGKHLFREMKQVVLTAGEGVVQYMWQWKNKPGEIKKKSSYVKLFEPWGWIIGTGIYVDDVRMEMSKLRQRLLFITALVLLGTLILAGYIIHQARLASREQGRIWSDRERLLGVLGEQEERYRSLVENITTGVALIGPNYEVLALNKQMRKWFPGVEASDKPICYQVFADDCLEPCQPCLAAMTYGDGETHEKISRKMVDGRELVFRVVSSPIVDTYGGVTGVIEMFDDITKRLQAEQEVRTAEAKYRSIFVNAVEGIYQTSPDGRYLSANPALARIYGYETPEEVMEHYSDLKTQLYVEPGRRAEFVRIMGEEGQTNSFVSEVYRNDGARIWIWETARVVLDENGEIDHYAGTVMDITASKRIEQELARQRAYFEQLFESSPLAIVLVDENGLAMDVNTGFADLFGLDSDSATGQRLRMLVVPERLYSEAESFHRTIFSGKSIHKETQRKHADGTMVPVSVVGYPISFDGEVAGAYYIYQDITERKTFEKQLSHQAFHDSLTSLPNRSLYMERLGHALERAKRRDDYYFSALMIDLNRFKRINDTLGHQVGDQLLVTIALRILSCIRTVDTVARLGGDEFAILLEEFESPREVIQVANRITEQLAEPAIVNGHEIHTGASIGIVLDTRNYETAEDILRDADIAMYQAKEIGKARLVFNRRMHAQAVEIGRMEAELRTALSQNQFMLFYQPIVGVQKGELRGFEALIRWNHPKRGVVGPTEFIPLAEETGLIVPMGHWVLREACSTMAGWLHEGECAETVCMSVNISARQFAQPDLVEYILGVLNDTGMPPVNLKLEITESVLMEDALSAQAKLRRLKELGVQLMIDDFGTGYSSLSYLQQFPVDYLKIDQSFISGSGGSTIENLEIVKTIMALAKNLDLKVVAEGVEQPEQLEMLRGVHCDNAQGFMFSRPVDEKKATDILERFLQTVKDNSEDDEKA